MPRILVRSRILSIPRLQQSERQAEPQAPDETTKKRLKLAQSGTLSHRVARSFAPSPLRHSYIPSTATAPASQTPKKFTDSPPEVADIIFYFAADYEGLLDLEERSVCYTKYR